MDILSYKGLFKMKSKKILSLLTSMVVGFFVVSVDSYAAMHTKATPVVTSHAQMQKDGEIIAVLIAVDKNEIALAKEALKKQITPAIKQYARLLKRQHTQNLNETLRLSKKSGIAPIDTALVTVLQQDGAKGLVSLSTLNGIAFEKAYIHAMVKGHTQVLKIIDHDLLKHASNPLVKNLLLTTRPHIDAHLQAGKVIQKELR